MEKKPCLWIIIPCYNESEVLPITAPMFSDKIEQLVQEEKIAPDSRILFVNDGSKDDTWEIICRLSAENPRFQGICQSRNRGHQNAVLAGLMEAKDRCDITISIDCDGQDDINAMDQMVEEYLNGCEIVYGVRSSRETDTWFKRTTAQGFYKVLNGMGAEVVYNHADYRLVSSRVLQAFADFHEVNLFLRGMFPLVGFKSTSVYYERHERIAGESHHQPVRAADPHGDGNGCGCQHTWFYRDHLGGCGCAYGKEYRRMGVNRLHRMLSGRNSAPESWHYRRIHRQDLYGDEAPSEIYYQ